MNGTGKGGKSISSFAIAFELVEACGSRGKNNTIAFMRFASCFFYGCLKRTAHLALHDIPPCFLKHFSAMPNKIDLSHTFRQTIRRQHRIIPLRQSPRNQSHPGDRPFRRRS